jgi:hypothetical protein
MAPASQALMVCPDAADMLTGQHRERRPGFHPLADQDGVGELGVEDQPPDPGQMAPRLPGQYQETSVLTFS